MILKGKELNFRPVTLEKASCTHFGAKIALQVVEFSGRFDGRVSNSPDLKGIKTTANVPLGYHKLFQTALI